MRVIKDVLWQKFQSDSAVRLQTLLDTMHNNNDGKFHICKQYLRNYKTQNICIQDIEYQISNKNKYSFMAWIGEGTLHQPWTADLKALHINSEHVVSAQSAA